MSILTLYRSNIFDETKYGRTRRLILISPAGRIHGAIEKADDPDMMPPGEYPLVMTRMHTSRMKALWLRDTELFGHPANRASQLKGCWAPGTAEPNGVSSSTDALWSVFEEHGGWREAKEIPFRCVHLNENDYGNLIALTHTFAI